MWTTTLVTILFHSVHVFRKFHRVVSLSKSMWNKTHEVPQQENLDLEAQVFGRLICKCWLL